MIIYNFFLNFAVMRLIHSFQEVKFGGFRGHK